MEVIAIILIILGTIVLIFASPFINFVLGWIVGWLIKIIFGTIFISGLKLIGIDISIDMIPLLCGTLNLIGSFFRSSAPIDFKNNKE